MKLNPAPPSRLMKLISGISAYEAYIWHLTPASLNSYTYFSISINSRSLSGLFYRNCSYSGPMQPSITFCATRMNFLTRSGPSNFNYFYSSLSVYALYLMLSLISSVITKFNGYFPSNYLTL